MTPSGSTREHVIDANERQTTRPLFGAPTDERGVLCHGCTGAGQCRFGLRAIELGDDGVLHASVECTEEFEGAPGLAHGGWISAVLDDMTGFVTILRAGFAVTAGLEVAFRRPVRLGEPLVVSARPTPSDDGRHHVLGELRLRDSGTLLARADAVYVLQDESYLERGSRPTRG